MTGRRAPRPLVMAGAVAAAALLVAACGAEPNAEPTADTAAAATTPEPSAPSAPTSTISVINEAATVSTPADRDENTVEFAWIGGSDVELDGRSLVDDVQERMATIGDHPFVLVADIAIGPLPPVIEERVRQAAARNVDAMIVPMQPSWTTWTEARSCDGITPPHTFYSCILEAQPAEASAELAASIERLVDTIVASGIPTLMYVIPHSADSLENPLLRDRLLAAEARLASFDPAVAQVRFIGEFFNRDLPPMREGQEFNDMVHLAEFGVDQIAEAFVPVFEEFWAEVSG